MKSNLIIQIALIDIPESEEAPFTNLISVNETGKYLNIDLEHCSGLDHTIYPMATGKHYRCIAAWTNENYTYTVISTDSHDRVWVLRQTGSLLLLLGKVVAPKGDYIEETNEYMKLEMLRTEVDETLCVDAIPSCGDTGVAWNCRAINRHYCQLTCELCNSTFTCEFKAPLNNTWVHVKPDQDDMVFDESTISMQSSPVFRCQEENDMLELGVMYTLFDINENGCYPNIHCVLIRQVSPSVVIYKGLKTEAWPDQWMSQNCASANVTTPGWQVMTPKGRKSTVSVGLNDRLSFPASLRY